MAVSKSGAGAGCSGTGSCTITMTENLTVTANFEIISTYTTTTAATTVAPSNYNDFLCTESGGVITIVGYVGAGGAVEIPGTIDGMPVTGIGSKAFYNETGITSIVIPDGITSISWDAFNGCTSVDLPA